MRPQSVFGMKPEWEADLRFHVGQAGYGFTMAPLEHADLSRGAIAVPLTLRDRAILAARRAAGETVRAVLADAAAEAMCHDKLLFNRTLIAAGLGEMIPPMLDALPENPRDYPVIVKPRQDEWGRHTRILTAPPPGGFVFDAGVSFLQRYVPGGQEYSTHLLLRGGEILFARTLRFEMTDAPYAKGKQAAFREAFLLETAAFPEDFMHVLRSVGFHDGTCCIDYRIINGKPVIFEVNPRFGASLAIAVGDYLRVYQAAV